MSCLLCLSQVGPLWYLAQLTFNLSLAHTSVTSNTVLSSTSSLFTFLISVWVLHEVFNVKKLFCILLLIAGKAADANLGIGLLHAAARLALASRARLGG